MVVLNHQCWTGSSSSRELGVGWGWSGVVQRDFCVSCWLCVRCPTAHPTLCAPLWDAAGPRSRDITATTLHTAVTLRQSRLHASPSRVSRRYQTSSADGGGRGRSLRQTAARITVKAEPLKPCCALGEVSSCSSVDTVHLFTPLWKMQPRSCCCSGLWTVVFRESQGVSFLGEPVSVSSNWLPALPVLLMRSRLGLERAKNTTQWTFHLQNGRSTPTTWTETFLPSASYCTS